MCEISVPLRSTTQSVNTAVLVRACVYVCVHACACVCVCVCVCVRHARRSLSDMSALEIWSRGGSGFNSLPVRSPDFEKCWAIPLSAYVEVDSSLFVSERICGVRCRKLRPYSVIPFLLSLSVYRELTAIKTFTGINLAQSLHVCKPWCKRLLVWYPLARLHGLKQKYFQHCDVTNCPAPRIENIPNRDTTVSYRTKPWILWTVTPLIYILGQILNIYIYAFSRRFYPKRLTVHSGYTFFISMCVPWESNPQPFALLTQCSTTEPQVTSWCQDID